MQTQDQPQEQAPAESQSIADRVAAQFGVSDQSEEPEETATEAPVIEETEVPTEDEFVEVEYGGQRAQVPKFLEKAILQEKDYTLKNQAVAEKERQFAVLQEQGRLQAQKAQFEAESAQELQQLQAYDSVLSQKVDWEALPEADVARTLAQRSAWKDERDRLRESLNGKYQNFMQARDATLKDIRTKAADVISKKIPNWNEATAKEIREFAKNDGYTDAELAFMDTDPRHAHTLYKAMQYDKLIASKAKAVQTATKAPPMVKPGTTRPMPQGVKNDLALKKAQASATNSSDRAKIIQQRLEGRF